MRENVMAREVDARVQDVVTSDTSAEHEAIVVAIQALEAALASPAPGREDAWRDRIAHDLAGVVRAVVDHCRAAESSGGLIAELEATLGRPRTLATVSREHERLAAEASDFLESLAQETDVETIRARAADLTSGLRAHQAHETDLIYEAFFRDIGVGD